MVSTLGGNLIQIGTLSIDGGEGVDDLLVLMMSSGEVLVYSGSNPSSDFSLNGTFRIAEPVNEKRGMAKLGGDLIVITREGYLPLSQVFRNYYWIFELLSYAFEHPNKCGDILKKGAEEFNKNILKY